MKDISRDEFKAALERIRSLSGTDDDRRIVVNYCLQQTCENNWQIECETSGGYRCRVKADILWLETAGRLRSEIEENARRTNNYRILEDLPNGALIA